MLTSQSGSSQRSRLKGSRRLPEETLNTISRLNPPMTTLNMQRTLPPFLIRAPGRGDTERQKDPDRQTDRERGRERERERERERGK